MTVTVLAHPTGPPQWRRPRTVLACVPVGGPAHSLAAHATAVGINGALQIATSPHHAALRYAHRPADVLLVDAAFAADPASAVHYLRHPDTAVITIDAGARVEGRALLPAVLDAITGARIAAASRRCATRLTAREYDVLVGIASGHRDAEIGRRLGIGANTVKTHARHVYRKLGARDRTHAVALAFITGLLSADTVELITDSRGEPRP